MGFVVGIEGNTYPDFFLSNHSLMVFDSSDIKKKFYISSLSVC